MTQAERTGYDSACIKIFGGNISYVCHFSVAKLQKWIVDMCVYITCPAQPSCFLKLMFHMNSIHFRCSLQVVLNALAVSDSEVQLQSLHV
jgi:hypothetical protein